MPNTSGTSKKHNKNEVSQKNNSGCSEHSVGSGNCSGTGRARARKRKRCETLKYSDSDLESEFEDCDLEDAIAIEKKLRKIARVNSLSDEEMRKLLAKFVKNEHILALVTIKAEDELARERREAEQRAIIITDTPAIPKLTRARARELNRTPAIALPSLSDVGPPEIASLIKDDLHSDEDDEEYTFKEEDFISDEDPNTTVSDMESNPRTPQTPLTQTEYEDSPVKFTEDGCFKIPFDKQKEEEDMRIATRTRSKFCLQQTTIEDLQSEFVPPDVDHFDVQEGDLVNDEDWMQFLNDFSKPLNNSFTGDDDDPVNDPEYVAAEKIPVDAEELRDVNISKKELTELVAELFEGLLTEGISLESVELETPQKFIQNSVNDKLQTPSTESAVPDSPPKQMHVMSRETITRQINFDSEEHQNLQIAQSCVSDATISSTNITQNDYSFHPDIMSTPSVDTVVPIASSYNISSKTISISETAIKEPELIAVPLPGQPNCYQLARVVASPDVMQNFPKRPVQKVSIDTSDTRYCIPYDTNYTWKYISLKKHVYSEYIDKFESLKKAPVVSSVELPATTTGFTQYQHDLLQQQLRIHVQLLTQNFLQTYSHPVLWKWSGKPREMLYELKRRAIDDASFNAWNLNAAVDLITEWEKELSIDNNENREMMRFLNKEVEKTNRNTRQIARFHPRIMECMLNSSVFMYPEYLPRIPFTAKACSYHVFSPAESHLIALGLEKHMIYGRNASRKPVSLRRACERMSRDNLFGKTSRRIWDHIKVLRNAEYYNPVKYFFEHKRAPPIECKLHTFPDTSFPPPRERVSELPLVWQKYIKEKELSITQNEISPSISASEEARTSYLDFVREALGEDIPLPENLSEPTEPELSISKALTTISTEQTDIRQSKIQNKPKSQRLKPQSVTINVNYIFGGDPAENALKAHCSQAQPSFSIHNNNSLNVNNSFGFSGSITSVGNNTTLGNCLSQLPASTPHRSRSSQEQISEVAYNYDINTQTLEPCVELNGSQKDNTIQSKLTDYYDIEERGKSTSWCDLVSEENHSENHIKPKIRMVKPKTFYIPYTALYISQKNRKVSLKYRNSRKLKRRYNKLFTQYRLNLQEQGKRYQHRPILLYLYRNFKALELYTEFLTDLKMYCKSVISSTGVGSTTTNGNAGSPLGIGKRARQSVIEEETSSGRSRKAHRQEENFRHMLLPESAEDGNRKDAIYAFNFYEKVEEVLKSSHRQEDCKKFNHILKSFDPKHDKVSDLYYKLENLLLPDHPELAQVFLTFLLPSEAAEIGKFFEHFMVTNMTTFINKLNIYFHKQPAQIRKVYNCLNELAEMENVTMKKIEAKILPLLKGNQFLIDWFTQLFPEMPPPERLLSAPEYIHLKEVQNNQNGEYVETVQDVMESPTQEQQNQCQLRYINGRIFYGSRITLPAKLSFMAQSYQPDLLSEEGNTPENNNGCIHAIREHGENRLIKAAAAATSCDCNGSDDNEKSEEDDNSKNLVIDTAGEEETCLSTIEICDDAALHAHAVRLNPNYYSNSCYSNSVINTPVVNSNAQQTYYLNSKKLSSNLTDDFKLSPRKHHQQISTPIPKVVHGSVTNNSIQSNSSNCGNSLISNGNSAPVQRDKRKSPIKKSSTNSSNNCTSTKSPTGVKRLVNIQPMVVIHEQNSAIACAKKLKSLIDDNSESEVDSKESITIVARTKHAASSEVNNDVLNSAPPQHFKVENTDDLECLPEHSEISLTLSQTSFPAIKMDVDSTVEDYDSSDQPTTSSFTSYSKASNQQHHVVSSTHIDSDEESKLDIVATLATSSERPSFSSTSVATEETNTASRPSSTVAWTRDEDKVILIEMKLGSRDREDLFQRIKTKLQNRSLFEIIGRHQFLIDFLSKLQGN